MKKNKNLIVYLLLVFITIIFIVLLILPKDKSEETIASSYLFDEEIITLEHDIVEAYDDSELLIVVYQNIIDDFSLLLEESLEKAKEEFSNKLAFIYRPFYHHSDKAAYDSSLLALCANSFDKGREARKLLLSEGKQNFSLENLENYSQLLEIDLVDMETCLADRELRSYLENMQQETLASYILGSPTLIVGDELINGARPYEKYVDSNNDSVEGLRDVIKRQLADNLEI